MGEFAIHVELPGACCAISLSHCGCSSRAGQHLRGHTRRCPLLSPPGGFQVWLDCTQTTIVFYSLTHRTRPLSLLSIARLADVLPLPNHKHPTSGRSGAALKAGLQRLAATCPEISGPYTSNDTPARPLSTMIRFTAAVLRYGLVHDARL